MVTSLVRLLAERGVNDVGIITFAAAYPWAELTAAPQAFSLKGFFNNLLAIWHFTSYDELYYAPGDVLGGGYSERFVERVVNLARSAHRVGVRVTFCGFSINAIPHPDALRYLRLLPSEVRLCCRDALSQQRLSHMLGRNVDLVADLAFLLRPDESTPTVHDAKAWADQQRAEGRKIVGVNLNHRLLLEDPSLSLDDVIDRVSTILAKLAAERDVAFLFIPHDFRLEPINDVDVLRLLSEAMSRNGSFPIHLVERRCWAGEIKAICGAADLVVSGRMHLAIASLGQAVPVVGVTYQGKFEGLMLQFNLKDNTFSLKSVLEGDQFYRALLGHFDRCDDLKRQVHECLPAVLERSRNNVM